MTAANFCQPKCKLWKEKMKVAGIDVGSRTVKVVILEDSKILSQSAIIAADEAAVDAERALDEALKGPPVMSREDLEYIVVTGTGRKDVPFASKQRTSMTCLARGAYSLFPGARIIIDMGAETCTVIKLDERGRIMDSVGHDRCAAGTGIFLETMARLMQMSLDEMANLSLLAEREAEISNTCAVFAEQEVVSNIHRDPPTPKSEIIAGIHGSVAERIVGLCKRVGIKEDIVLTGGVAKNQGLVKKLEEKMGSKVKLPERPQIVAALGAALIARESQSETGWKGN